MALSVPEQCADAMLIIFPYCCFRIDSNGFYGNKDAAHIDSHKSVPFVDVDLPKWFRVKRQKCSIINKYVDATKVDV